MIKDNFDRVVKYMRISVTDRCNFRCRYCNPQHEFESIDNTKVLRYEDILFAVNVVAKLGVEKIRVTGGEPLVRKGVVNFLSELTKIDGIKEVTLTTNGSLLETLAESLLKAGIHRVNISLDSLKSDRYSYVTGGASMDKTLSAIKKVKAIGMSPIKTNAVIIKGYNDDEIIDFCHFAKDNGVIVRFIEFMPIGNSIDWKKDNIMTGQEILEKISTVFTATPLEKGAFDGPAKNYNLSNGATVGIITPMSEHFCLNCDKLRLTSDGKIRPCLLSDSEISVSEAIKAKDEKALITLLASALGIKNKEHNVSTNHNDPFKRTMSKIGG